MSKKEKFVFALWAAQRGLKSCKPPTSAQTYYNPEKPNDFYTPIFNRELLSSVIKSLDASDKQVVIADLADSLWLHEFDYEETITDDMFIRILDATFEQMLGALYTLHDLHK